MIFSVKANSHWLSRANNFAFSTFSVYIIGDTTAYTIRSLDVSLSFLLIKLVAEMCHILLYIRCQPDAYPVIFHMATTELLLVYAAVGDPGI